MTTAHPMVFRLVLKLPPSSDLLRVSGEVTFFAREGEKALELLRSTFRYLASKRFLARGVLRAFARRW
ncbi:MAG: hypothetical protein M3281_08330 [Chloroflexota bacterium]|nr:hypothetical protein [Chloroflexota bacterium]